MFKKIFSSLLGLLLSYQCHAAFVNLGWDASTSTVNGYKIYYGPASRSYTNISTLSNVLAGTINGLVTGGTYYFTVSAYTTNAESDFSNEINYTVPNTNPPPPITNIPPQIGITSPTNNQKFLEGSSINIVANASDADGLITKVEFYVTNSLNNSLIFTDTSSPYTFTFPNINVGNYVFQCKAYDNSNAVSISSPVSISVTNIPTSLILVSCTNLSNPIWTTRATQFYSATNIPNELFRLQITPTNNTFLIITKSSTNGSNWIRQNNFDVILSSLKWGEFFKLVKSNSTQSSSVNIVGYYKTLLNGSGKYTLVANPFDDENGNNLSNILSASLPKKSSVLVWNGQTFNTYTKGGSPVPYWLNTTNLPSGVGFFVRNGVTGTNISPDITNVWYGTLKNSGVVINNTISTNYSLLGSPVPYAGNVCISNASGGDNNFNFSAMLNKQSQILTWNKIVQSYNTTGKGGNPPIWFSTVPIDVGEGFFVYNNNSSSNVVWTQIVP